MTDIRVGLATDADRFRASDETVWFQEVYAAPTEAILTGIPADQRFAAEVEGADRATYPGIYGVFALELAVPGAHGAPRLVPCAGLTWVGVHPDHRRKGILTAMLRDHFERVRETPGTHVSALHASEPAIYGRHGYGLASLELEVALSRGATLTAPGLADAPAVTTQMTTITDPGTAERMRSCHRAHAETGEVVGGLGYYEHISVTHPEELRDKEPWRVLFAQRDGEDVGFAVFRREHKWERARPAATLEAWKVVGDPATRLALLRRLVDFDLVGTVKLRSVSSEDPLLAWAGGPRGTSSIETYDSLWVRIVDLPEALAARTWSAPCDVVVQVDDKAAPWNDGRWRVVADADGFATAEPTDREADLRLPVEALGASYVGGGNLVGLVRAGLVTEARVGAARELWRSLRTDVAPAAAVGF